MTHIFNWFMNVLEQMASSRGPQALALPYASPTASVQQEDE